MKKKTEAKPANERLEQEYRARARKAGTIDAIGEFLQQFNPPERCKIALGISLYALDEAEDCKLLMTVGDEAARLAKRKPGKGKGESNKAATT